MRKFPSANREEFKFFRKLNSPQKIQDFVDGIPINFQHKEITCRSPALVLKHGEAHCIEGALLAAAILWYHGERPLLLDIKSTNNDYDHVVALFREYGRWGAISKTNHAVLRYRDPIYKNTRELAVSYFNEYFLEDGAKTMRSYSKPFSVLRYDDDWLTSEDGLWQLNDDLDNSPHSNILRKGSAWRLRPADSIEIRAGDLEQWEKKRGTRKEERGKILNDQ